ncbi:MAG: hypothetical protein WC824_11835 [Bacteroidota bacterium]|jgi:hypothetical protein
MCDDLENASQLAELATPLELCDRCKTHLGNVMFTLNGEFVAKMSEDDANFFLAARAALRSYEDQSSEIEELEEQLENSEGDVTKYRDRMEDAEEAMGFVVEDLKNAINALETGGTNILETLVKAKEHLIKTLDWIDR